MKKSTPLSAKQFIEKLETYRSPVEATKSLRYFKTGAGQYGEGDVFIGVRMGPIFALAKEFVGLALNEIEKLLDSPIHEVRMGGMCSMDIEARSKRTPIERRRELYDLYLRRHDRINNWDLVDRAAPHVIGGYLFDFDQPRKILYRLARSRSMWERRTAMVSTLYFIGKGDTIDALKIAEMLLQDDQDLIHKATGWALRDVGDKDRPELLNFLDKHAANMPRTALRYALEHFAKKQREHYLKMKSIEQPKGNAMKTQQPTQQISDFPKLSAPAQRALANAGIKQLKQLTKFSEAEIKQLHGIGPNALDQLRRALGAKGLAFAPQKQLKKAQ
jgi:3-methyladenine DNA glycosylase AlkD